MGPQELTPHLFRTEYSKIVAVLCRTFHFRHIEIAADIASETFLKASEYWAQKGVPENPAAWLYTVARNKAKDYLKHTAIFETEIRKGLMHDESWTELDFDFNHQTISDSQLAMIFAACNPVNSSEAQLCLTLQILCGFSLVEISNALLAKQETIKKRLQRARENLRNENFQIKSLSEDEIKTRFEVVLRALYLLFNEGYFSKSNSLLIRKDLCLEAIRLALVLTGNELTDTPEANALLALMCFQSSRLEARTDESGAAVLFDEQDRSLWDQALIQKGNHYLIQASKGTELSKYHLEAAIAYWHTTTADPKKWQHILNLYNELIVVEYSPVTALNRVFAYAKVYGNDNGIREAEKLNLKESGYFHGLLGYLYTGLDSNKALEHYRKAILLTKSEAERKVLEKQVFRLIPIPEKDSRHDGDSFTL
ncbi:RNA polymerase sigma factor [Taibaiella soli]|uniref:RNA polymerase subunit sigma n=1 Tax=Taibaiella soli TaxID=1649169 RepID=A0A2W2AGV6_9BACT|nr:sigma-70 family RNA polymerase sigma factor [Taibaiella soli]PZF72762.1 RNA polymerase subunit sigma [Taibaiella soli]